MAIIINVPHLYTAQSYKKKMLVHNCTNYKKNHVGSDKVSLSFTTCNGHVQILQNCSHHMIKNSRIELNHQSFGTSLGVSSLFLSHVCPDLNSCFTWDRRHAESANNIGPGEMYNTCAHLLIRANLLDKIFWVILTNLPRH